MLQPVYTNQFAKDVKKAQRRSRDMDKMKDIIRLLINELPLPLRLHDHSLSGNYTSRRECHIEPDWLLIYKPEIDRIIFERTGSHSDLFR